MCGLAGMAGPGVTKEDLEMLRTLTYTTGLRGLDGTGVIQGRAYKGRLTYQVHKSAEDVPLFLKTIRRDRKTDRLLDDAFDNFFIVHCRAATIGDINDSNAHPFETPKLIGAHNGTLKDKKYFHKDKTDSQMMFEEMSENGIKDVLENLEEGDAYAVSILDKLDGTIKFSRNKLRPLWFAINRIRGVLYWSSEESILRFALDRHGIDYSEIGYCPLDVIYSVSPWEITAARWPFKKTELKPAEKKTLPEQGKSTSAISSGKSLIVSEELQDAIEESVREGIKKTMGKPRIRITSDGKVHVDPKEKRDFKRNPRELPKEDCSYCGKGVSLLKKYFVGVEYDSDNKRKSFCSDECKDKSTRRQGLNEVVDEAIESLNK